MKRTKVRSLHAIAVFSLICLMPVAASAISISPDYGSFGSQGDLTFGGSGIPNDAVAETVIQSGGHIFRLDLTAHERYDNPPLANDGAGTFYASPGGDIGNGKPDYAIWNFAYSVSVVPYLSDFNPQGFSLRLWFDTDPAPGNDVSTFVPLEPNILNGMSFDSTDSWNLGMGFIGLLGGNFDPNAVGEYGFALALYNGDSEVGRTAIRVNAGEPATVPDNSPTLYLFAGSMVFLPFMRRKLAKI